MKKRALWLLVWVAMTAFVVVAARGIEWGTAVAAARQADTLPLLMAILFNAGVLVLTAAQWLVFLPRDQPVRPGRMFEAVAITSLVANGGPVGAAHAATVHLVARRGGVAHSVGVSILFLDQLAEGVAKVTMLLLAAAFVPMALAYRSVAIVLLLAVPAFGGVLVFFAHRGSALDEWGRSRHGAFGRSLRAWSRVAGHLEALRNPSAFGFGVLLSWAQKVAEGMAIFLVVLSFGVTVPLWGVLAVLVAVSMSTLISVTPANLGVYEGSAFLVYRALGVDSELALAMAIVQHAVYLIPMVGAGWGVLTFRPGLAKEPT